MAKWEPLIAAREQMHLSQMEAAERVNVGFVTYQRWENGKTKPQPHNWRRLHEAFGTILKHGEIMLSREVPSFEAISDTVELILEGSAARISDACERVEDPSSAASITEASVEETRLIVAGEEIEKTRAFIAANMITHLWSLAFLDHPTCNDMRVSIRQAIEEFDIMNATNKNYQLTRRDALCALATLPMITLGLNIPGKMIQPSQYGNALAHCAASVEACWELCWNNDASNTRLAFETVSKYLAVLQRIINDSSEYRQKALDLAARYALLKTLLGWILVNPAEVIPYAQNAVTLSEETGDLSLQLSAYSKLAWAYFYDKKYPLALAPAQQAVALLQHYQQHTHAEPVHPSVSAGTYSTLALVQASNRQSSDLALGKVTEIDPGDESYAFMTSERSTLLLEAGWTYCYHGDQAKAMEVLEKRIDPETLSSRMSQGAMGRVETLNVMALSSLKTTDRDMEKTIHLWVAGIEEAKVLKNVSGFNDAATTYAFMEVVWPNEPRIAELHDHLIHWE